MADDRTIRVRFLAEVGNYMDGLRKAGGATKAFGGELSGAGKTAKADVEKVGRAALIMSGGLALALGSSAREAMRWETAWAGVTKTVDGSVQEMQQLEDQLRSLATELPASHKEIAAVAEAAGQLGIKRGDIESFTEVMVALGVSTNLTSDQAATSLAQMMNIMQSAPADVERLGSTLVALGNAGASTESEILEMSLRLAGAGQLIGATEADVLALANAMASVGIQAQLGGGAMSRGLSKMYAAVANGGEDLAAFAKVAGTSAQDFATAFEGDPIAATDLFIKGLARIKDEGGNVVAALADVGLKGTQDRDVFLRLTGAGNLLADSLKLGSEEWERNIALQEEATKRYGTTESQMQITRNKIAELQIDLGDKLLPVIRGVVDRLGTFADVMSGLPGPVQTGAVALLALTTAGLGVVGIVGTLGPKVRELDKVLESMGMSADLASRNVGRFMSFAAKGGLVIGVLYGVGKALDAAFDENTAGNITETENALARLAGGASLDGLDIDVDSLGRALERIVDPSIATSAGHVTQNIASLGGLLGDFDDNLKDAKDEVDGLDKALASLAQKDPEAAAAALKALEDALGPEAFARLLPLLDDYEISLVALDTAGRTGAAGIEEVTNAAGVSETQIKELGEAIEGLMGQLFGVESAQDAWQQQLNDLDEVVKQSVTDGLTFNQVLLDQSDGAIALRGHLRDMMQSGADLITQWVSAGVSGEELNGRVAGLIETFREQATALGLTGEEVDHYVEALLSIPTDPVVTPVDADTTAAMAKLDAVQNRIFALGRQAVVEGPVPSTRPSKGKGWWDSRYGNVFSFAQGGISQAHVAKDGAILKYAEKATGGEAFVPRNGDAARSMGILRTAAGWYGADVVPAGQGSSPLLAPPPSGGGTTTFLLEMPVLLDGKHTGQIIKKQVRVEGGVARFFGSP